MHRDERIELELIDYQTAMNMLGDLHGRDAWSTPRVLAQWVATIRRFQRSVCLVEEEEHRKTVG